MSALCLGLRSDLGAHPRGFSEELPRNPGGLLQRGTRSTAGRMQEKAIGPELVQNTCDELPQQTLHLLLYTRDQWFTEQQMFSKTHLRGPCTVVRIVPTTVRATVRWRTHRISVREHAFPVVVHYMVVFWKHCPLQEKRKERLSSGPMDSDSVSTDSHGRTAWVEQHVIDNLSWIKRTVFCFLL